MYLCVGTYLTALLLCKASSTRQKRLGDAVFRTINSRFDSGDDDSAISAVFCGKRNLSSYLQLYMEEIDARVLALAFSKNVIPLLDENKHTLLVRLLQTLIETDDIGQETTVELVNRIKKKDLISMDEIVLEDFLAGIFIYAVAKTDNLNKQSFVKEFRNYAQSLDKNSLKEVQFIPQYSASVIFNDDAIRPLHTIYKRAGTVIDVLGADLFDLNNERKMQTRRNIVIPVNTSFETKFYGRIGEECIPLVSENTIHGQWLSHVFSRGMTEDELNHLIISSLRRNGYVISTVRNTKVGQQGVYPFASIASVNMEVDHYYLLAVSEFDEKNRAFSDTIKIEAALDEIVDYYDADGQGFDLYLPLLGTGRSRVGLTEQESYELIRNKLMQRKNDIYGRVHIVIHPQQIEQLTLDVI